MVTKEDVLKYVELDTKFRNCAREIWDYLYENHKRCLKFVYDSTYDSYYVSNNWFIIYYTNDCFDISIDSVDIPIEHVIGGTWKEYLLKKYK